MGASLSVGCSVYAASIAALDCGTAGTTDEAGFEFKAQHLLVVA
jgi:hypothetical protein